LALADIGFCPYWHVGFCPCWFLHTLAFAHIGFWANLIFEKFDFFNQIKYKKWRTKWLQTAHHYLLRCYSLYFALFGFYRVWHTTTHNDIIMLTQVNLLVCLFACLLCLFACLAVLSNSMSLKMSKLIADASSVWVWSFPSSS
jgi:hypothetical protein